MHKLLIALVCLLTLPILAHAEDPCVTQRNTVEMNDCGQQQLDKANRSLNQSYQTLIKKFSEKDTPDRRNSAIKQYLITAQRAWITFRENDCKAIYTYNEGGTIRDVAYLECMTQHTDQRAKELTKEFGPAH